MKCPQCGHSDDRVLETRAQKDGEIRRRRECLKCKSRFTTVESVLLQFPHVKKKDGRHEPFSPEKLRKGIQLACLKRPVSLAVIEGLVNKVSRYILEQNEKEISSLKIGQFVMRELKKTDDVAYVRFASVYRTFKDVQEFVQSLEGEALSPQRNQ